MELREAVKLTKGLAEQFAGLAKLGEAMKLLDGGEQKIDALLAQQQAIAQDMATKRAQYQAEDLQLTQALDQKRAATKTEMTALTAQIDEAKTVLTTAQREQAAVAERGRQSQREITAGLLSERRVALDALNQEITDKQAQITRLRDELAKLRERVGV